MMHGHATSSRVAVRALTPEFEWFINEYTVLGTQHAQPTNVGKYNHESMHESELNAPIPESIWGRCSRHAQNYARVV